MFYTIKLYTVSLIYLERCLYLENKLLSLSIVVNKQSVWEWEYDDVILVAKIYFLNRITVN